MVGKQNIFELELLFYTILSINPKPATKNQHTILIGIIIAVLLIELIGKPKDLMWTGGFI